MKAFSFLRAPLLGLLFSVAACLVILLALGESPGLLWEAFSVTLGTSFGLGYTLFYTTPLIFTGLAVALSFHCGLFNIGAEGQLYIGSIAIVAFSTLFPTLPAPVAGAIGLLAAGLAGAAWGGIAGFLKARRGSHEVIVTILMNFLAYSLVDYLVLYPLRNPEVQNPETVLVPEAFWLPPLSEALGLFPSTPVNVALFLALLAAVIVHFFLFYTTRGFEMRTVGKNAVAARFAGVSVATNVTLALALSGALAGLVGVNEVMGHQHRVIEGFSPGYGFTGIAVALLARSHPLGIVVSAFLFGALHNSAREIEFLSDKVTKELSLVLQGTLIAFIACDYLFEKLAKFRPKKKEAAA